MATTIQLDRKTKSRLENLKMFSRGSYDDVIKRLINITENDEDFGAESIRAIERSLNDIKKGKIYPLKQVEKELTPSRVEMKENHTIMLLQVLNTEIYQSLHHNVGLSTTYPKTDHLVNN